MNKGINGKILEVNLSTGHIKTVALPESYYTQYFGGRGLGMRLLYDYLPGKGVDALGEDNPLLFVPGMLCGYPLPSASRSCMVTKSPMTSPVNPKHANGSTISYSNMGGFIGPEIKFAGYDAIVFTGVSEAPVYLLVEDDQVSLRPADKFWGMGTDAFDKAIIDELGDRRFETAYIGPGAENGVLFGSVINTAARAAGRGGTGTVMGSKKLKAIAVRGTKMPEIANIAAYNNLLEQIRLSFAADSESKTDWRYGGTANALQYSSDRGSQAVKNYSEGSFANISKINADAARKSVWKRDFACYACHLACKKSGFAKGAYGGVVHEGIEYETGTMLGANLLVDDLNALNKMIEIADDYGIDIISLGNVLGFLMECHEKALINLEFLDGIDLKWGDADSVIAMIHKIGKCEGIGKEASKGVKHLASLIGSDSSDFAIHVKGHELAAWNVQGYAKSNGKSYTLANRGACHMNGGEPGRQDQAALRDTIGICSFAASWYRDEMHPRHFIAAVTGTEMSEEQYNQTGERIYNLEKMLNLREGFGRADDVLPERFFKDGHTYGPHKDEVLKKTDFKEMMDSYYAERGWDVATTIPKDEKLNELDLDFVVL
ncbi:MAG: aldehyde ferredoxin oxidoreductase family protein [Bacteroidetes bacterium]|nr:aldehyde ferredoxin oxidoreductase family protein [Bacteroidota bacterium]MBU1578156.1 aldehyde ferredoxin oxidoreductase family protein [Bacteroidota bacterium]MBU2557570.1 aldehyde ferredoxin oxidoreductase family protein [Bacteroidota bacterium]